MRRIKARTGFERVEIVVPHYERLRIIAMQAVKQCAKCCFLRGCTGVGRTTCGIKSALVTDTNGVAIVVFAMRAHGLFASARIHFALAGDVVMIANVAKTTVANMVGAAVVERETLTGRRGRAVDYYQRDGSHRQQLCMPSDANTAVIMLMMA